VLFEGPISEYESLTLLIVSYKFVFSNILCITVLLAVSTGIPYPNTFPRDSYGLGLNRPNSQWHIEVRAPDCTSSVIPHWGSDLAGSLLVAERGFIPQALP
jgi:hypothetical protein